MADDQLLYSELTEKSLDEVASALLRSTSARIFLFDGPMGSGKTTFIKAMCRALGSHDAFSSPTYSIVNVYGYPGGSIAHFDLYRLSGENELLDIGADEYLDRGDYCFIEWPGLVKGLLESPFVECTISVENEKRFLACSQ
jgi:tRNA threonylcarbamoyladenosine biosynthesis protein TsaE